MCVYVFGVHGSLWVLFSVYLKVQIFGQWLCFVWERFEWMNGLYWSFSVVGSYIFSCIIIVL